MIKIKILITSPNWSNCLLPCGVIQVTGIWQTAWDQDSPRGQTFFFLGRGMINLPVLAWLWLSSKCYTMHLLSGDRSTSDSGLSSISQDLRRTSSLVERDICDRIWENPPYEIRARFTQCAFLVAQVQICQSPDFVISMSNNPSSNCSRCLRRLVVSYKGKISLHFDPPSLYGCRIRSPLLREIIRIRAHGLSSYS